MTKYAKARHLNPDLAKLKAKIFLLKSSGGGYPGVPFPVPPAARPATSVESNAVQFHPREDPGHNEEPPPPLHKEKKGQNSISVLYRFERLVEFEELHKEAR